ncbi:hypothetical protein BUALT_Bualt02G0020800 [Buddleja alternifolia]|uniref:Uncharacterized protein n=1 Tax=Buddleja alternifolia TaxID=168488 RepID=A0AAV6Y375_9LAMI|nr:hypothetical protein BUALT_Bualt02G0020800 [Buddleja alternifolia]
MKVIAWFVDNFRFDVVFSKAIFFMLGLICSYSYVNKAVIGILITHLTEALMPKNLPKAAIVVNLSEGTSAVLQIFFAVVADAYLGRFTMVVCSAIAYTIGLGLCYLAARDERSLELRIFYTALAILTLAQAAINVTLKTFLDDQLLARDHPSTEEEKERAQGRSNFWWNFATTLAAIVFGVSVSHVDSFRLLTFASAILMAVTVVWFLLGTKFYERIKPTAGSPLSDVPFVIHAAITKRKEEYPQFSDQLFQNTNNLVQVLPHVSWLRWLDKAAVKPQEKPRRNLCSVEQVKGVKFLLKVLPIWTTFIIFSVVAASGSTFFLEEANQSDQCAPIQYFVLMQSLTKFVSDFLLKMPKWENVQRVMLVRIGIGMICSVLCCITASVNAAYWLHLVNLYEKPKSHTNVFRLTPQFFLLGLMEGLSQEGFDNFFESQVSESLSSYVSPLGEFVMGIGNFVSVICILIFSRWFKDDINSSRLDRYYEALAAFSFVNLLIYCYVAYGYRDDGFFVEEVDTESGGLNVKEDIVEPFVGRSLSDKGHYNYSRSISSITSAAFQRKTRSFPGNRPEEQQQLQVNEESVVALLIPREDQQLGTAPFSPDINSMDIVSVTMDGSSTATLLRDQSRSFTGIHKRINSMRLIFSYSLVDKAVVGILITHLTEAWKHQNLPKAAIIVNLSEGTSAVLQIFFAFVADAYLGRFRMLVCSAIVYTSAAPSATVAAVLPLSFSHIPLQSYFNLNFLDSMLNSWLKFGNRLEMASKSDGLGIDGVVWTAAEADGPQEDEENA